MFENTVLLRKVIILALTVQLQTNFLCLIDEFTCVAMFSWLQDPKSGKLLIPDGFHVMHIYSAHWCSSNIYTYIQMGHCLKLFLGGGGESASVLKCATATSF
jgi:hypothetical protein